MSLRVFKKSTNAAPWLHLGLKKVQVDMSDALKSVIHLNYFNLPAELVKTRQ